MDFCNDFFILKKRNTSPLLGHFNPPRIIWQFLQFYHFPSVLTIPSVCTYIIIQKQMHDSCTVMVMHRAVAVQIWERQLDNSDTSQTQLIIMRFQFSTFVTPCYYQRNRPLLLTVSQVQCFWLSSCSLNLQIMSDMLSWCHIHTAVIWVSCVDQS